MVTSLIMVMYFLSTNLFDDYIRSLWRLNNNDPSNGQLNDADNEDQSILVLSDTERRRALKSLLKSEVRYHITRINIHMSDQRKYSYRYFP